MASASVVSVIVALLIVAGGLYGLSRVASGFIPIEDQGYLVVAVQLPDGASLERTQKVMDQVGADRQADAGRRSGRAPSRASRRSTTRPRSPAPASPTSRSSRGASAARGRICCSLFIGMNKAMDEVMDARVLVVPPPPIQGVGNASGATMQIELRDGSFDFRKLQTLANADGRGGIEPVELPAHDDDVPRRRAAVPHRCRPREGADAARQRRSGVLDHPDVPRLDLCRAVQQVRPHLPGLRAGGRAIPSQARGHHPAHGAQQPGPDGADRHARVGRADRPVRR